MERTSRTRGEAEKQARAASREKKKRLSVYRSWCKRCGLCVAFCPKGALERDPEGFPRWKDATLCVACRMCELRCPDFAIEVAADEEGRDEQGK